MEDYKKRVIVERDELNKKVEKLGKFISGGVYTQLDDEERYLLNTQYNSMAIYLVTLDRRIQRWSLTPEDIFDVLHPKANENA